MDAKKLISKVAAWSRHDDRVLAAGLLGSHACGEARPDSDIDFCILTQDPGSLLDDHAWIYGFGKDARVNGEVEDYALVQSLRVFYGMIEAEFGVTDQAWAAAPIDADTARVINNGLQVLCDPKGYLEKAIVLAAAMNER